MELFAVELCEEKCRLVEAIIWASAVVTFGMMTLTLLTLLVVVLFWQEARIATLVILSVLYLLATFLVWRGLRSRLTRTSTFSGTVGEIEKDRECLGTQN